MSKNIHYPLPNFRVNYSSMYVYYNSLNKDKPKLAENVKKKLAPLEQSLDVESADSKMNEMISFLEKTISKERENEARFLQTKIKNNPFIKNAPKFQKKILECFSNDRIDYYQLIALFLHHYQ